MQIFSARGMVGLTAGLLLAVAVVAAETQSGVVRSTGQAIPGAAVTAICGTDRISTVTDEGGRFEIGGLPKSSCQFSVGMFGFEPAQKDAAPSATPLEFDLPLQKRATLAKEPAGPGRGGQVTAAPAAAETVAAAQQTTPAAAPATPAAPAPATASAAMPSLTGQASGPGRGGSARNGSANNGKSGSTGTSGRAAGQTTASTGRSGYQSLRLQANADTPAAESAEEVAPTGAGSTDSSDANQAFVVSGSLSSGVVSQPGDSAGLNDRGLSAGNFGASGFGAPGFTSESGGDAASGATFTGATFTGGGTTSGRGGGPPSGGGRGGGGAPGGRSGRGSTTAANRNTQFGNRVNKGRGQSFQGSVYDTLGNSVFNARPYSFTSPTTLNGAVVPKAAYASNKFGLSMGGPLYIPHLISGDKTFWFVNYTGSRLKNGFDHVTTVPTQAERNGDFSGLTTASGQPVIVTNPLTGQPFPGNAIPASYPISPAVKSLLTLIPLPNSPGLKNNYQLIGANPSDADNLQVRVNQTLTSKDGLDVNFSYQHRNSANVQTFGFIDPTSGYGLSSSLTYRRTFNKSLINSLVWSFSRNITQTDSAFSFGANIEGNLGITGVTPGPLTYGPPTLNFTNFGSLSDASPSLTRAQTSGITDTLTRIHGKQTMTFGFGFQRRQNNTLANQNARGTFSFTGVETGYDMADFLLNRPYQTSVLNYLNGNNSRYLRETTLSLYGTDDYRMASNFTINAGLRWEYFGPYTEKNNQMANLDFNPAFTAVAPVVAGGIGPYSGQFPQGLIQADHKLISPRIGTAWKPWKTKSILVRSGYGIYYNGGVYSQLASRMVGQPPFATTTQLLQSAAVPLTLENGFPSIVSDQIANTFSVDKNYQPGYSQNWTVSIQESIGRSYIIELAYSGVKGTHLDVLQLPNRAPLGTPQQLVQTSRLIPNTGAFTYDNSIGNSTYNSAQFRFTRRFSRTSSFTAQYTFAKAIDDSSTLGGGAVLIPGNIAAERALSPFDQRHQLRLNYTVQSPIASTRQGTAATLLRGWTLGGVLSATSGTPSTATVTGDPSGTGYSGAFRAQATGLPVTDGSGFFNPAAFTVPANGTFGNAGRDTIPGIARFTLSASLFRSFRIDDKRRIEFRLDTSNPLNNVNITSVNTTVNSIQYGLPANAAGMRSMTTTVRLRF